MQANDMATTVNKWETPGTSVSGRHNIASYFFQALVQLGQLDRFFLPREEVLCDGFDLIVLDPSDRREADTCVSLLLRITRWGLFLHK